MNLKELLSGIIQPICAIVLDENTNRVDAVKAIETAWQGKIDDVETIVDALVHEKSTKQINENKALQEKEFKNDLDQLTQVLTERLEVYLAEAREQDRKENQQQIIAEARLEVMTEAMSSIVDALAKSSLVVETDTKAQFDEIEKKNSELKNQLNSIMNENIELKKTIGKQQFNSIFESIKNEMDLSDIQANRLKMYGEGFANDPKAGEKLRLLANSIIGAKTINESEKEDKAATNDKAATIKGEILVEDENVPQSPDTTDPLWTAFKNVTV